MCGAKNASAEMRSNVTFVSRMGSFVLDLVLDYHGLNVQPPFQHIEIPYRAFPERVGPRILSLESVHYFGTSDYLSGREKKNDLNE